MSFYYLFIPTWFFSAILYTTLAYYAGATKDYAAQEAEEVAYNEAVKHYQTEKSKEELTIEKDKSIFSKVLTLVSIICLILILWLAIYCFISSPDMKVYQENKDMFNKYAFMLTLGYFATAYWALLRQKALNKRMQSALDKKTI